MGACVSTCIRALTRIHDERVLRKDRPELDLDTIGDITAAEKQPSVLLVFSVVERQNVEIKIVSFLRKVFQKAPGLVYQRNPQNETLLYFTCKQGKVKVIKYLLDLCSPAESCPKGSAIHACVHAMHSGNLGSTSGCDVISELLDRGCDIDVQDAQGRTAFYLASAFGCLSAVMLLADRGCDVRLTCFEEMTALHAAGVNGDLPILHYLLGLPGLSTAALDCHKRTPLTVTLMGILRPSYFTWSWYHSQSTFTGRYEREFGSRAAIVERLLMAGADPRTRHMDREFVPQSSANHLCYVPISLALCAHDIIKEERSKTYQRATMNTANNPGPNVALPCPELTKLDTMGRLQGVTVAMVMQLLEYGAEVPHDDLEHYAPPLLQHLQEIAEGQGIELEVSRARPLTLQKLCRTCIRVHIAMGPLGFNGIPKLPVPSGVKQFLQFHQG